RVGMSVGVLLPRVQALADAQGLLQQLGRLRVLAALVQLDRLPVQRLRLLPQALLLRGQSACRLGLCGTGSQDDQCHTEQQPTATAAVPPRRPRPDSHGRKRSPGAALGHVRAASCRLLSRAPLTRLTGAPGSLASVCKADRPAVDTMSAQPLLQDAL